MASCYSFSFSKNSGENRGRKGGGEALKETSVPQECPHTPDSSEGLHVDMRGGGYNQCSDAVEVHVLMKMVGFVRKQRGSGSELSLFFTLCVSNREPKEIRVFRDFLDRLVIEARREIG